MISEHRVAVGLLLFFLLTNTNRLHGQALNSGASNITLAATANESLGVSLGGSSVSWNTANGNALVPGNGSNPGNTTVSITTSWKLKPGRTAVKLYAYFDSSTAALAHTDSANSTDIPASAFQIKVDAGTFTAVTTNAASTAGFGAAGAGLQLDNQVIGANNKNDSSSVTLSFNLDLSSVAMQRLPADTYQGTLHIQAQATP